MATRKQQKRKQKARAHGYVRDTPQQQAERPAKEARPARRASRRPAQPTRRSGSWLRTPPEPTFQRSIRRSGTLVLPALLLLWYFLSKPDQRDVGSFLMAVALPVLVFIPFDYYATRFMNTMVKRKTGGTR
jgi:hypothetical protein